MSKIEQEIQATFENYKQRFVANLLYTSNCFRNLFVDLLKPYGVSMQQFNVLRILRGKGEEMTINSIKERMIDKSPNLARLADKLISKELIERRRSDSDRRVVYLTISEKGLKLLAKIDEDNIFDDIKYWDSITEEEAKIGNEILDKIKI